MKSVSTLAAVLATFMITASAFAQDPSAPRVSYHIPAQPIVHALQSFGVQSDLQLVFLAQGASTEVIAAEVLGNLTHEEALRALLAGTDLTYKFINGRTVVITAARKLTQAQPIEAQPAEYRFMRIRSQSEITSAGGSPASTASSNALSVQDAEEVIVTGSRLALKGESAAPVTVFNRSKINELGVTTVPELLRYLPSQPYLRESQSATGAQYVEIRGLGVDTTLVLLNGRRLVPTAADVARNAVDLNSIPLAAVERVEVLSDSASAVYGADAVGGVVNIILKKDIEQPTVDLSAGTASGGAEEYRASLSMGHTTDRLRTSIIADFFQLGSLLGEERDRFSNQDFRRFGGIDARSLNASPGNISSTTLANLPGLSSRVAGVPDGSSGVGLTPADFSATAGRQNYESLNRYLTILPESERRTAAGFVEFDLTQDLTAFSELLYVDRQQEYQSAPPAVSGAVVPVGNPFNPFGVPVVSNFLLTAMGPQTTQTDSELYRGVLGLRGAFADWSWEVAGLYSNDDSVQRIDNVIDPVRLSAALASTDPALALNVFQDGPGGSPQLLNSLRGAPQLTIAASDGTQGTAYIRGPLFSLPAGDVRVVVGSEWRKEEIFYRSPSSSVPADRTSKAGFAELSVPLIGDGMNVPMVQSLSLTVAGRYDSYSDFGDSANAQYGLTWTPVRDLLFRASYGTAFRPPSLVELYAPQIRVPVPVADPRRNGQVSFAQATFGGNASLDPVDADSRTVGFVYTPSEVAPLRFAASYWRVHLDRRVTALLPGILLPNESLFPGRVVRAPPTAADLAAGLPGVIQSVNFSNVNFGSLDTAGVDAEVSWGIDTPLGQFTPSLSATWVDKYATIDAPNTPSVDRVGTARAMGTITKWRGIASVAWHRGAWGLSMAARYRPSYDDINLLGQVTGRDVGAQTLVDLNASYKLEGPGMWGDLRVSGGVSNLFDEDPEFSTMGPDGYDPSQGQLRQRFGYLAVSKSF